MAEAQKQAQAGKMAEAQKEAQAEKSPAICRAFRNIFFLIKKRGESISPDEAVAGARKQILEAVRKRDKQGVLKPFKAVEKLVLERVVSEEAFQETIQFFLEDVAKSMTEGEIFFLNSVLSSLFSERAKAETSI